MMDPAARKAAGFVVSADNRRADLKGLGLFRAFG
jgi:hypothetical protein